MDGYDTATSLCAFRYEDEDRNQKESVVAMLRPTTTVFFSLAAGPSKGQLQLVRYSRLRGPEAAIVTL